MGEWIGAAEAAQRLGVKQATLYAYVSRGMLSRRRGEDGRSSLFDADELARLTAKGQPRRAAGTGDFVIESELTEVADGRFRYRGMEVTKLALWRPFEEVAGWLWTGSIGRATQPWQATSEAIAAGSGAQAALPDNTLPLERLRVIVPAMAATDLLRLHLDPPAVVAAGRNIIAGMVDCLPDPPASPASATPAIPSARLAEGGIAGRFWYKICPRRPDPGLLAALRAAMALLADHELAASTFAARMAASVRADPYAVVATGLGALGTSRQSTSRRYGGGASLGAETMLAAIRDPADAVRVVGDLLRRGERIPGLGDFADSPDPRARALLDLVKKAAPRSARFAVAAAVLDETRRRALPEPNVDFALATLANVAGMIPGAGEAIFAVSRTAGWIAHAMEEYAKNVPLRPRTVYIGPTRAPSAQPLSRLSAEPYVALGVGDGRPVRDVADRAGPGAPHVDGQRAALGRHEQVPGLDASLGQLRAGQPEQTVVTGVLVRLAGVTVGEVGGLRGTEAGRDESGALHADVTSARQAGGRQRDRVPVRLDRVHPAAGLVRRDEIAGERAECRGRHRDPALHRRGAGRDRGRPPVAVDAEHGGVTGPASGDQQPVPEPAGGVERDPVQPDARRQAGERPLLPGWGDQDDLRSAATRLKSENLIFVERTVARRAERPGHQRDVRFAAGAGLVPVRAAGERRQRCAVAAEKVQPPRRRDDERPVAAWPGHIHHPGQMPELGPAGWGCLGGSRDSAAACSGGRASPGGTAHAGGQRSQADDEE
jgi:citrate synthase